MSEYWFQRGFAQASESRSAQESYCFVSLWPNVKSICHVSQWSLEIERVVEVVLEVARVRTFIKMIIFKF